MSAPKTENWRLAATRRSANCVFYRIPYWDDELISEEKPVAARQIRVSNSGEHPQRKRCNAGVKGMNCGWGDANETIYIALIFMYRVASLTEEKNTYAAKSKLAVPTKFRTTLSTVMKSPQICQIYT
jgi:hypothetical protein